MLFLRHRISLPAFARRRLYAFTGNPLGCFYVCMRLRKRTLLNMRLQLKTFSCRRGLKIMHVPNTNLGCWLQTFFYCLHEENERCDAIYCFRIHHTLLPLDLKISVFSAFSSDYCKPMPEHPLKHWLVFVSSERSRVNAARAVSYF